MKRIAKFEKISFERFDEDFKKYFLNETDIQGIYNNIMLPKRATIGSAGYDIFAPVSFELKAGQTIVIPTGIRIKMQKDWAFLIMPRSGLGFKFRLQLDNTIGAIDSDYYYSENEGHIFIYLTNDSRENKTLEIKAGQSFAQGIFLQYGITDDDCVTAKRTGGLGSTTK